MNINDRILVTLSMDLRYGLTKNQNLIFISLQNLIDHCAMDFINKLFCFIQFSILSQLVLWILDEFII